MDKISSKQQERITELFARAIHDSEMAFASHDTPAWRNFFQVLRPAWRVPPPKNIGGALLDSESNNVNDKVDDVMRKYS